MEIKQKTIVFILLGILAIYVLFNMSSSFKSTFGFGYSTTITVPQGSTSIIIPIKDTTGNNLGSSSPGYTTGSSGISANGFLTIALTPNNYEVYSASNPSGAPTKNNPVIVITDITPASTNGSSQLVAPQIKYTINGMAQQPINLAPLQPVIPISSSTRETTCITSSSRAQQGYNTDNDWATAQCSANNYVTGVDSSSNCSTGGYKYVCKPNTITLKNTYTATSTPITVTTYKFGNNLIPVQVSIPDNNGITSVTSNTDKIINVPVPGYVKITLGTKVYNYLISSFSSSSTIPTGISWTNPTSGLTETTPTPLQPYSSSSSSSSSYVITLPSSTIRFQSNSPNISFP